MTAIERALAWCKEELRHAEDAEAAAAKHGSDDDIRDAAEYAEEVRAVLEALEKQTAQVPGDYMTSHRWAGMCPRCDAVVLNDYAFCHQCGQKLDWRDDA